MASATTIKSVTDTLTRSGVTNSFVQAGILSRIERESSFVPKSEISYRNTPNARIRTIFGSRVSKYSETQLTSLKANDTDFFDAVYGGRYGNTAKGDGFKYRGRGLNQLTFKDNYKKFGGLIGKDLVSNPDLLNNPDVAAAVAGAFFADGLKSAERSGQLKTKFGINSINEVKDTDTGAKLALQTNAGWGTNLTGAFLQEELAKMKETVKGFFEIVKANPGKSGIGTMLILTGLFFLVRSLIKKQKQKKK